MKSLLLRAGLYLRKQVLIQVLYLIFRVEELHIDERQLLAMIKKVIVLGGSSGIGKAVAQRFAKEGWQVLVAAHDMSECIASVNELNGEDHMACQVDVRKDDD